MQNEVVIKDVLHSTDRTKLGKQVFQSLVVVMRILFGMGWLLAGVTKITGKPGEVSWYTHPTVFLTDYLNKALTKPNVPDFYKYFIKHVALHHETFLNDTIPVVQIILGVLLILGLMTFPAIFVCLFMHINFILSGNINIISLTLYTSAFSLLLFRKHVLVLSLDRKLKFEDVFIRNGRQPVKWNEPQYVNKKVEA